MSKTVSLRVAEDDLAEIDKRAKALGLSRSAYLVKSALGQLAPEPEEPEEPQVLKGPKALDAWQRSLKAERVKGSPVQRVIVDGAIWETVKSANGVKMHLERLGNVDSMLLRVLKTSANWDINNLPAVLPGYQKLTQTPGWEKGNFRDILELVEMVLPKTDEPLKNLDKSLATALVKAVAWLAEDEEDSKVSASPNDGPNAVASPQASPIFCGSPG